MKITVKKILLLVCSGLFIFIPQFAHASGATMSIAPASGQYKVGQKITAAVRLLTGGNAINAAEGHLHFSPDLLSVASISKSGTIFSYWPAEPSYDNSSGTISFAGGSNNAFSGSSGKILTITFNVKAIGSATLNFDNGRILAADGNGTNVYGGSSGAQWQIIAGSTPSQPQQPSVKPPTSVPPTNQPQIETPPPSTQVIPVPITAIISNNFQLPLLGFLALLLILLLLIIILLMEHRFHQLEKNLTVAEDKVAAAVRHSLQLREDLLAETASLEKAKIKRKLTAEEARLLRKLHNNLHNIEQFVGKEIDTIE